MTNVVRISAIIPTTAEASRRDSLNRAIDSLLSQEGVDVDLVVLVNGQRFDKELLNTLRADRRFRVEYQEIGSLPRALCSGRQLVRAPYFCFLDDDDEYLPGALRIRTQFLIEDPKLAVLVTNGYNFIEGKDQLRVYRPEIVAQDPLMALMKENWLASCGGLFRTNAVGTAIFQNIVQYYEWTWLAFLLATQTKVRFENVPTYRVYDTPASLSKTTNYYEAEIELLKKMLSIGPDKPIRNAVREKISRAQHFLSAYWRVNGNLRKAWVLHVKSLASRGGYIYIPYTRKLIFPFLLEK